MDPMKVKNRELTAILLAVVTLIIVILLIHDLISSLLFNQAYFIKESLLFKTNFALFYVAVLMTGSFFNSFLSEKIDLVKAISFIIPICTLHVIISSVLIAMISQYILDTPFTFSYLIKTKFINDFIKLLIIYAFLYLLIRYYFLVNKDKHMSDPKFLVLKIGTKYENIALEDIDWIGAQTPYVSIWLNEFNFLYQSSLSELFNELDSHNFIRIHRSTIININKIKTIKSRSNGDYDIELYNNKVLRLSRNYRESFKSHTQLKL